MYELPTPMYVRFWFYINALPIIEEIALYLTFISGMILLVWCIIKISNQINRSPEERLQRELKMRQKRAEQDKDVDQKTREMDAYSSLILGDTNLTSITMQ